MGQGYGFLSLSLAYPFCHHRHNCWSHGGQLKSFSKPNWPWVLSHTVFLGTDRDNDIRIIYRSLTSGIEANMYGDP
jgi:hypothetical protein